MSETDARVQSKNHRLLAVLVVVVLVMLVVGVPVLIATYNLVCDALGLGQNPQSAPATAVADAPERRLKVYFEGRALGGLPVVFFPEHRVQEVRIGEDVTNVYVFKNTSRRTVRFRPIHNVTPSFAAQAYSMMVCFCFNDQEIEAGGEKRFEVVYRFNPDLDRRITTATVRYDLHPITAEEMRTDNPGVTRELTQ